MWFEKFIKYSLLGAVFTAAALSYFLAFNAHAATTVLPVFGGGTGWANITSNDIPYGNGGSALATSSLLTFNGTKFTTTNASTTVLSATTFCLTGDICRTTWPAGGGSGWPFTPTTYAGTAVQSTTTPLYLPGTQVIASSTLTVNATTTSLYVTGVKSALLLDDSNGQTTAYGGSSDPCSANQAPTTLSALGALGGCTSTFLTANQTVTLTGDVTGSGATSIATTFALGNSHWWAARQNFTNATSSGFEATSTAIYFSGVPNSLLSTDQNGKIVATSTIGLSSLSLSNALTVANGGTGSTTLSSTLLSGNGTGALLSYGGATCSNQFVRSLSGAGAATCNSVSLTADITGTLGIANGGTATTTGGFTNGVVVYDGSKHTTYGGLNYDGTKLGVASTSPSALWGASIGTTTVFTAQAAVTIASSTTDNSTETVDWNNGNQVAYILNQNTNIAINSTSSHPVDGGRYILDLCQDPTGSRTVTFATPGQLIWPQGTTTISSTANTGTWIGFVYKARIQRYVALASSTIADTRVCKP